MLYIVGALLIDDISKSIIKLIGAESVAVSKHKSLRRQCKQTNQVLLDFIQPAIE